MSDRPAATSLLSDSELITTLQRLVREDRRLTAHLLLHLAEVDMRKLYLRHACSSMHVYCVERLHMSDQQAYRRIHAARAGRRYPRIFEMVARNELHLSGIALLALHLTQANHNSLLDAATHKTKRQIEHLIAKHFPQPDAPAMNRRLPHSGSIAPSLPAVDQLDASEPLPTTRRVPRPPPRAAVTPRRPSGSRFSSPAAQPCTPSCRRLRTFCDIKCPTARSPRSSNTDWMSY